MLISKASIEESSLKESSEMVESSFPFRTACSDLRTYPCRQYPWHWHEEAEILYVTEGRLAVHTPGQTATLEEGDIVFLPSNVLHSTSAVDGYPGVHKEYIFSPLFIGGSYSSVLMQKYVLPLLHEHGDQIRIKGDCESAKTLQTLLNRIQQYAEEEPADYEFRIHQLLCEVWGLIREEAGHGSAPARKERRGQAPLYRMTAFIRDHYAEAITLEEIAAAGGVSTRECSRIFRSALLTSAMEYLLRYRIDRACARLATSSDSVTEIGFGCGFASASYFTKRFRERTGKTPKEYRNTAGQ